MSASHVGKVYVWEPMQGCGFGLVLWGPNGFAVGVICSTTAHASSVGTAFYLVVKDISQWASETLAKKKKKKRNPHSQMERNSKKKPIADDRLPTRKMQGFAVCLLYLENETLRHRMHG